MTTPAKTPVKCLVNSLLLSLCVVLCAATAAAQSGFVDVPVNSERSATTARGLTGLPASLGTADDYMVVLRIAPLRPGIRYEATMTYDEGTDIGFGHAWVDGNPYSPDWASFVGIGTGTGTQDRRDKQEKFLFTIDRQSTANTLYLSLRSSKPFTFRFGVSSRLSGVTANSQDRSGYYYVNDFDASRTAPFLLKRGQVAVTPPPAPQGAWVEVPVNTEKSVTTALGVTGLPTSLGSAEQHMVILRIAPLRPGVRYEATLTYDEGADIGYSHAWVDGNPFKPDWASFVGIGSGTGTQQRTDKQQKFLFSVDPRSTSNALFLSMRSSKPFTFRFGVSDRLTGVTRNSQDRGGFYFVDDFDASRTSPFLLKR